MPDKVNVFFVDDSPVRYLQLGDLVDELNKKAGNDGDLRFVPNPIVAKAESFAGRVHRMDTFVDIWRKRDVERAHTPLIDYREELQQVFACGQWAESFASRVSKRRSSHGQVLEHRSRSLVVLDMQLQPDINSSESAAQLQNAIKSEDNPFLLSNQERELATKLAQGVFEAQSRDPANALASTFLGLFVAVDVPVVLTTTNAVANDIRDVFPEGLQHMVKVKAFPDQNLDARTEEAVTRAVDVIKRSIKILVDESGGIWEWLYGPDPGPGRVWNPNRLPSELTAAEWKELRDAIRIECPPDDDLGPNFAHHAEGGGQYGRDGRDAYDEELLRVKDAVARRHRQYAGLFTGLELHRWRDMLRGNEGGLLPWETPPFRALAQFDDTGEDLSCVFRLLHQQTMAIPLHHDNGACYLVDNLVTFGWKPNCLWFNACALAQGLYKLAERFTFALRDHPDNLGSTDGLIKWDARYEPTPETDHVVIEVRQYLIKTNENPGSGAYGKTVLVPCSLPSMNPEEGRVFSRHMPDIYNCISRAGEFNLIRDSDPGQTFIGRCTVPIVVENANGK